MHCTNKLKFGQLTHKSKPVALRYPACSNSWTHWSLDLLLQTLDGSPVQRRHVAVLVWITTNTRHQHNDLHRLHARSLPSDAFVLILHSNFISLILMHDQNIICVLFYAHLHKNLSPKHVSACMLQLLLKAIFHFKQADIYEYPVFT